MRTPTLRDWTGGERATLAIVFTDVVRATELGKKLADERMREQVRQPHFARGDALIAKHLGYNIKTNGDSIMAVFRYAAAALDFALELQADPGAAALRGRVRAGIHYGEVDIEDGDIQGTEVNVAGRLIHEIKGAEIWLSDPARTALRRHGPAHHDLLEWAEPRTVVFRGLEPETFTLWPLLTLPVVAGDAEEGRPAAAAPALPRNAGVRVGSFPGAGELDAAGAPLPARAAALASAGSLSAGATHTPASAALLPGAGSLYSDADTFYTPTVTPGAVNLSPALYSDSETFYTPAVDAFIRAADAETQTRAFLDWVGDEHVILAIVFTDIVGSTDLLETIKHDRMSAVQDAHFAQSRKLIAQYNGREINTMGDGVLAAFHSAPAALDYAYEFCGEPGHAELQARGMRAAIHVGPVQVKKDDLFGSPVHFTARIAGVFKGAEIWLSDEAKTHIDSRGAARYEGLKWECHDDVKFNGYTGAYRLWSLIPATSRARPSSSGEKWPLPPALVLPARPASSPRREVARPPHNFEDVESLSRYNVVVDRRTETQGARILAQFDFVERFYVRARHGRVEFEVQRAFIIPYSEGQDVLSESDALRDTARDNVYYLRLRDMPVGSISVCIEPEPGKTGLGKSALPPTHGENELSEIAIAPPELATDSLKVELRISLNPEGLYLADEIKENFSEIEAMHIKAILRAAAGRNEPVVRGQIRKPLIVRERSRDD
jgi:class 3 adenylate cyclase